MSILRGESFENFVRKGQNACDKRFLYFHNVYYLSMFYCTIFTKSKSVSYSFLDIGPIYNIIAWFGVNPPPPPPLKHADLFFFIICVRISHEIKENNDVTVRSLSTYDKGTGFEFLDRWGGGGGVSNFTKQALVFTCLQKNSFENAVGKGEIAHKEQLLLFPQCFLPIWITFVHFYQI